MVDLNIINLRHYTNDHRVVSIHKDQTIEGYYGIACYLGFVHPVDRSTVLQSALATMIKYATQLVRQLLSHPVSAIQGRHQ